MNPVAQIAQKLSEAIPVEWDRFTKTEDGFFVVYGWIARPDGPRDFLMYEMMEGDFSENVFYTTSSAKYSREISQVLYGSADDHNSCRKIEELFALK